MFTDQEEKTTTIECCVNIFDKKGQSVGKRAVSVRPAIAGGGGSQDSVYICKHLENCSDVCFLFCYRSTNIIVVG